MKVLNKTEAEYLTFVNKTLDFLDLYFRWKPDGTFTELDQNRLGKELIKDSLKVKKKLENDL